MSLSLALMPQLPPTGLPCEYPAPKPSTRSSIQVRPIGPRQPRTQCDLNDRRLRRVSAVACAPSKHSLPTPGIPPKPPRPSTRVTSAPSFTSVSSQVDGPSLVSSDTPSLVMTTTMTVSSPAQLRVSDSTPPFLLQKTHGPPPYFLHRAPVSVLRSPSSPHLKQKRSFKAAMRTPPTLSDVEPSPPTQPRSSAGINDPNPATTSTVPARVLSAQARRTTSPPRRPLPKPSPPPEKALPPIPFPSRPSSPPAQLSHGLASMLSAPAPSVPAGRPVSQDAEETLRQLEQLAAELKQMDTGGVLAVMPKRRRSRGHSQRRRREHANRSAGAAAKSASSKESLSVPRIVVTNPSTENLAAAEERDCESDTPRARTPDSDGGSGDVTEEELWVHEYGGWGTSEKGKWKAKASEDDETFPESKSCLNANVVRQASGSVSGSAHKSRSACCKKDDDNGDDDDELFYIYEPIGAPEFLVGCSTSLIARATPGFHSSQCMKHATAHSSPSTRRRRRRPAALVLATPEQAEWFADVVLGSAPLMPLPRPLQTPLLKDSDRPSTAPGAAWASVLGLPAPPLSSSMPSSSSRFQQPSRRAMSSGAADVLQAGKPHTAAATSGSGSGVPRASSAYVTMRSESGQGQGPRQAASWASAHAGVAGATVGTSSSRSRACSSISRSEWPPLRCVLCVCVCVSVRGAALSRDVVR
ncbi:hypothetical protein GY45DRAFT_681353 [Cubamyces sp. BRFM 1775]|nr:hypothetical protein GY45DRAFT_681353 [Cubamyces sp. BRFM 1775]